MTTARSLNEPPLIAVLADIHYGEDHPGGARRCGIADVLLERAVRRLNALIQPDVVLVLGDLVDDGDAAGAEERLQTLRGILDRLESPYLAIPGNHDGDPEQFYRVFPRPADVEDHAGIRFLAFVDRNEPGCNASRCREDVERIRQARVDHAGPIVALQHVCLFPPELDCAPYNYTNAPEIIAALKQSGVALSVSGHHHRGADTAKGDAVTFVNAPGLCESPFPFLTITLDGERVETERHELAMPSALNLVDNHLHTQLAYCSENMAVGKAIALAKEFGLAGIAFTEHSGQLYYDRRPYWDAVWLTAGLAGAHPAYDRMDDYLACKRTREDAFARFSLEVDCDARGNLLLKAKDRPHFDWLVGSIHVLPCLTAEAPPQQRDMDDFLFLLEAICQQGICCLAHPLRIFSRMGWEKPAELFEPTADILREYGVAAEVNFHSNKPPVDFIRCCLDRGVRLSFGSDAHNLAEIGDFSYHLDLLKNAGFNGDVNDVLVDTE